MHSQMCRCVGACVHTGIWEQMKLKGEFRWMTRDHDTLGSRCLGCSHFSREKGMAVMEAERVPRVGGEVALTLLPWSFSHSMAPNPKTRLCSPALAWP